MLSSRLRSVSPMDPLSDIALSVSSEEETQSSTTDLTPESPQLLGSSWHERNAPHLACRSMSGSWVAPVLPFSSDSEDTEDGEERCSSPSPRQLQVLSRSLSGGKPGRTVSIGRRQPRTPPLAIPTSPEANRGKSDRKKPKRKKGSKIFHSPRKLQLDLSDTASLSSSSPPSVGGGSSSPRLGVSLPFSLSKRSGEDKEKKRGKSRSLLGSGATSPRKAQLVGATSPLSSGSFTSDSPLCVSPRGTALDAETLNRYAKHESSVIRLQSAVRRYVVEKTVARCGGKMQLRERYKRINEWYAVEVSHRNDMMRFSRWLATNEAKLQEGISGMRKYIEHMATTQKETQHALQKAINADPLLCSLFVPFLKNFSSLRIYERLARRLPIILLREYVLDTLSATCLSSSRSSGSHVIEVLSHPSEVGKALHAILEVTPQQETDNNYRSLCAAISIAAEKCGAISFRIGAKERALVLQRMMVVNESKCWVLFYTDCILITQQSMEDGGMFVVEHWLSFSKSHLNDASAERIKITSASGEVFRIRDDIVDAGKKNCARDQSSVVCLQLEEEWEAAKGGKEGKVSASSRFAVHHLVSMLYAHSGKWLVGQSIRHGNLRPLHEAKEWLVAAGERIAQMVDEGRSAEVLAAFSPPMLRHPWCYDKLVQAFNDNRAAVSLHELIVLLHGLLRTLPEPLVLFEKKQFMIVFNNRRKKIDKDIAEYMKNEVLVTSSEEERDFLHSLLEWLNRVQLLSRDFTLMAMALPLAPAVIRPCTPAVDVAFKAPRFVRLFIIMAQHINTIFPRQAYYS